MCSGKVVELPPALSIRALTLLQDAATLSKRDSIQLVRRFVANEYGQSMLSKLLQAGESRLKLYLTLHMVAAGTRVVQRGDRPVRQHRINGVRAGYFAELLDFGSPERGNAEAGTRRVLEALVQLKELRMLRIEPRPGGPSDLVIMMKPPRYKGEPVLKKDPHWARVPIQMWSNGWILALPARALAVYIALQQITYKREGGAWISRDDRAAFHLSPDTWTRGVGDLRDMGLLQVWSAQVKRDRYQSRTRQHYLLDKSRLTDFRPDGAPADMDPVAAARMAAKRR